MIRTTILLCGIMLSVVGYAKEIQLTPDDNDNLGLIPSGHDAVTYMLQDGHWTNLILLPTQAKANDKVTIIQQAQLATTIQTQNINIPIDKLKIKNGQRWTFLFNATLNKWELQPAKILSPQHQAVEHAFRFDLDTIQHIQISNRAWTGRIVLPETSADGTLLKISSSANLASTLDSTHLLFDSSYILKKGDQYWLRYYAELKKWVVESIQARQLNVKDIGERLKQVDAAVTQINFSDGNWVPKLSLPASAKDRDRVIVSSTAGWAAKIENTDINSGATLSLKKGDRYEFVYIKDLGKWVMQMAPTLILKADDISKIKQQQLPNTEYPTTQLEINSGNWQAQFKLPVAVQINDKVIVKSTAEKELWISSANGLKQSLRQGETQRYVYSNKGWEIDSYTLDVLFVSSPEVVKQLGESAAKIRIMASQELTNLSAQNSNAQFYLRQAGYMIYKIHGDTLDEVLDSAISDEMLHDKRDQFKADMIYYEGAEQNSCGLAYRSDDPVSEQMIASGTIDCDLKVMRHEIGHNLGLQHSDEVAVTHRGFNHALGSSVMGGNTLDYFSSPHLFSPKYSIRLGEFGKIDAVAMINTNAPKIASFR